MKAPDPERWTIGALLDQGSREAGDVIAATGLQPADFTSKALGLAFEAIRALVDAGEAPSPHSVATRCRGLPRVPEDVFEKLLELAGANALDRSALLIQAREVKRLSDVRKLLTENDKQRKALADPKADPAVIAADSAAYHANFAAVSSCTETMMADLLELSTELEQVKSGKREPRVCTGIEILDRETGGWVQNLNVIGGMPSVGKSALVAASIWESVRRGVRVGVFGLEDATKWIPKRLAARKLGVPVGKVISRDTDETAAAQAFSELGAHANSVLVYRRAGITAADLVQVCRAWIRVQGVGLIFVDHGGEVQHRTEGHERRFDRAVDETYMRLRDLAVESGVPVVVLSHFNVDTDKAQGGQPKLHNFAETAGISRKARLALGLWEADEFPGELLCTVLKNTEGRRSYTIALKRDVESALIHPGAGRVVDIEREREARRREEQAKKRQDKKKQLLFDTQAKAPTA